MPSTILNRRYEGRATLPDRGMAFKNDWITVTLLKTIGYNTHPGEEEGHFKRIFWI